MSQGLASRAGNALVWSALQLLGTKLVSLVGFLILARLLAPEDFGILAIAAVVIEMLLALTNVGVSAALVQQVSPTSRDYDTAWTMGLVRAAAIAVVLAVAAPYIAELFDEPRLTPFLRVLGLRPLIDALGSIGLTPLTKSLRLRGVAIVKTSAATVGTVGSVLLAIVLPALVLDATVAVSFARYIGVWAVVVGSMSGAAFAVVLSYFVAPHRPRLVIDPKRATQLLKFGRWLFVASVVGVAGHLILRALVSNQLGVAELGIFFLAVKVTGLPNDIAGEVVRAVVFPMVSKVQDDADKARRAFQGGLVAMLVLLLPVYALMFVLAESLVEHVLGEQWIAVIPVIWILAADGVIDILADSVKPLVLGLGHPQRRALLKTVRTSVIVVLAWPLISSFGIVGAALVWLVAETVQFGVALAVVRHTIVEPLSQVGKVAVAIALAAGAGAAVAWGVELSLGGLLGLIVATIAGLAVAWGALVLVDGWRSLGLLDQFAQAFPVIAGRLGVSASTS